MYGYIKYSGFPAHIICDQDPAFMSSFAQNFFQQFGIKIITVIVSIHISFLAENGI